MLTLRFVKHTLSLAWSHKTRWTCKVRTAQKVPLNTCSESFNMCLVRLLSVTVFLPLCLTLSLFYSPEFRSVVYFRVFETQSQFVSPLKGLNYFWQSSNLNKHKCYERTHVKHLSQWLSQRKSSIIMAITSVFFFFFFCHFYWPPTEAQKPFLPHTPELQHVIRVEKVCLTKKIV